MSALSDALAGAITRINEDFSHLRGLLDQALATDAADAATIAQLRADADAVAASQQESIDALNALDPDASNPPVIETPPPVDPNA